jgi:hypothetical protein
MQQKSVSETVSARFACLWEALHLGNVHCSIAESAQVRCMTAHGNRLFSQKARSRIHFAPGSLLATSGIRRRKRATQRQGTRRQGQQEEVVGEKKVHAVAPNR